MSPETSAQATPLVTVICRSMGRSLLQHALQSVNAQTYPHIEIVLVDAAGKGLGDNSAHCNRVSLVTVSDGRQYSRSQAANAGLDTATGQWLMFLDDDDWIAPEHIQNLVTCLQANDKVKAAYSNTQKTDQAGHATGFVFNSPYNPLLLMRDNYIPIHAMLFHRSLLAKPCRFDERFDIYEDWDFWLQLNQLTDFAHVDATTAFYREGGDSETAAADTSSRYQSDTLLGRGRAALFDKWLPHWSGDKINQMIGDLDQSGELQALATQLHEVRLQLDAATHQLHVAQGKLDQVEPMLANKDLQIQNLQRHAEAQEQHIAQVSAILDAIYTSMSWKLMGPFRRVHRAVTKRNDPGTDSNTKQD